jgi:hypothetical protein
MDPSTCCPKTLSGYASSSIATASYALQVSPAPITVSSSVTIHAVAAAIGYFVLSGIAADYGPYVVGPNSGVTYTVNLPQAATPTFNLASGTYTSPQTLTMVDTTPGATIY